MAKDHKVRKISTGFYAYRGFHIDRQSHGWVLWIPGTVGGSVVRLTREQARLFIDDLLLISPWLNR